MQPVSNPSETSYRFGSFELDPVRRTLSRGGKAIALKPKVFETLRVLVQNSGRVMDKNELMQQVWPDSVVEEVNLAHNISVIRKALGQRSDENKFIITVPGRGYGFVADVAEIQRNGQLPSAAVSEYELTRARVVIEEETDERDVANALETYTDATSDGKQGVTPRPLSVSAALILRRRRSGILTASLIVSLLIAGAFLIWRYYSQRTNPDHPAEIPFAETTIKQLTTKGSVRWAVLSRDGKFYAYTLVERGEAKESLWLGQIDGNNDIQLRPPDDVLYRGLAISSDGKTLYFTVSSPTQSKKGLFKMPVLGGVAEKLLDDTGERFALSPDGKQVAAFRTNKQTNSSALVVVNLDGTGTSELLVRPSDKPFSLCADWSPDSSLLAVAAVSDGVTERREIFVVRVADGQLEQLTDLKWIRISNLAWLRDGRGLIIVAQDRSEGLRSLWYVDYPGGNARRLSRDTDDHGAALSISDGNSLLATQIRRESNIWIAPARDLSAARQVTFSSINGLYGFNGFDWGPDNRLVFTASIDRALAIFSMDVNGSQIRQLTSGGFNDRTPSLTADGRLIVFQSNRSGSNEIWRANADGSDLKRLTSGGGNSSPDPTPDGRWVVYTSTHDAKTFVWRIPIDGGDPVRVTDREFSSPRVSPDGRLIACGYRADANSRGQLALVKIENGVAERLFDVAQSARFEDGIRWTPDGKAVCYKDAAHGIWRQDISGGLPQLLRGLPAEPRFFYGWSRDGRFFALTRGRIISDAVLINNSR
jgi:Tol biopolymer transport system component/DNA-binding winged helix-turn-helix (wHTH) protein